jgi:hypothetical protein
MTRAPCHVLASNPQSAFGHTLEAGDLPPLINVSHATSLPIFGRLQHCSFSCASLTSSVQGKPPVLHLHIAPCVLKVGLQLRQISPIGA